MSNLAAMRAAREAAKDTAADMTEIKKGGGGRLLPAGPALMRMFSYVEFGDQPQEFQGKSKGNKPEVQLGFAVYGPQYQNEDGSPYLMYPYAFALDQNEKAKAIAVFKAMNWKGNCTHFSDFLGELFLGQIVHEPKTKADPTIVSRINMKGFAPPLDAMSGQPYAVPELAEDDIEWFFFDQPTMESWQALYQEGNYDDGSSKNRIQETITGAANFTGSALEAMLIQAGAPIPKAKPRAAKPSTATPTPGVVQAALPQVGGAQVTAPLAQTGSVTTPAVAVANPLSIGAVQVPVISAPIVPAMTSPSNPALPQVG